MREAEHVTLPTIITGPGKYRTRCGEIVTIDSEWRGSAKGRYEGDIQESWDISGRLLRWTLSSNDIIQKLQPMKLDEIKEAVRQGKTVHWMNSLYKVVCVRQFNPEKQIDPQFEQWLICTEGSVIGLTWTDGVTMNGKEEDFYIE